MSKKQYEESSKDWLLKDKDKTIADLEAKLAQAQKTIEIQAKVNDALISENLDYSYDITDTAYEKAKYMAESWEEHYQQEIEELKQQLAVADDCADRYWKQLGVVEEENKKLKQQLAEKDKLIKALTEIYVKNKFDFAVEQLEKVKEFNIQQVFSSKPLDNFIDNQIEQLTHQHEEKGREEV